MTNDPIYKANIGGGELKVTESRIIAELLLNNTDDKTWHQAIVVENILQHKSPAFAQRQSSLIRSRLSLMKPELWELIKDGSKKTATDAVFAAAIKHSALLADFLDLVVRAEFKIYSNALTKKHWTKYLSDCHARDPNMPQWAESTESRLASSIWGILVEVGYLSDKRKKCLQPIQISPEVMNYLKKEQEEKILRCIQVP
ncbi:MAG: DUF1819 family protein [Gammaproteobacteria bacterium]|jgi:hypothetical protein|nr:DUF1819 family protein [Gammaproteobacteria bacterium]MBT6419384.1 DUF1819 family protein [Gammaproteobacteria bacterium]MBT6574727.1 DUF1819 family protein [Gammaproteobacteria bacterium]